MRLGATSVTLVASASPAPIHVSGYVGNDMLTPIKKPIHRDLVDGEKQFNKQINKIRYVIEQVIANFKTWRIMHTDYRRPLDTFTQTISTVIALHFCKLAP
jgi:hypothetical protein